MCMNEEQAIRVLREGETIATQLTINKKLPQLSSQQLTLLQQIWQIWQKGYAANPRILQAASLSENHLAILLGTYKLMQRSLDKIA